ncbi:MAG: hypothetical protein ACYDH6_24650 [Acidimicrobiales bacterium]
MMDLRLTDFMLRVASTEGFVESLTAVLPDLAVDDGDGWVAITDETTLQRVVVTEGDFGAQWALAVEVSDLSAALTALRPMAESVSNTADTHALVLLGGGVQLLLHG